MSDKLAIRGHHSTRGNHRLKKCPLCGKRVSRKHFTYCPDCSLFVARLHGSHLSPQAKQSILDYVHKHGFVCFYTGMLLDLRNMKNPWYCVFDHWIPGDDRKIVLTSFLINDMKTELSASEFWYYVEQMYNHFKKHTKVIKKKPVYWFRLYTGVKRLEGDV
jgi:hypothetical protein